MRHAVAVLGGRPELTADTARSDRGVNSWSAQPKTGLLNRLSLTRSAPICCRTPPAKLARHLSSIVSENPSG